MKSNTKIVEVLSDLIRINIDRISVYEKASHEDKEQDPGVRNALYKISSDSRSFVNNLHSQILRLGGSPVTEQTPPGNLYREFSKQKTDYEGTDPQIMLAILEYGEELVQNSYREALGSGIYFPDEVQRLLEIQLGMLERLHTQTS